MSVDQEHGQASPGNGARLSMSAYPAGLHRVGLSALCPETARFLPLGIPLLVEANGPGLLAAVTDACRGWEGAQEPEARHLRLRLICGRDFRGAGDALLRVDGPRLWISGLGVEAWADSTSGEAWCMVSDDYVRNAERLRDSIVDPLILFLLARSGRTPIHASGFLAGDLAVLLAGPSGAGKSCLALAAQEAGFALLSDDIVHVQLEPALRIWGIPRPIHVYPEDDPGGCHGPVRIRNGKLKHAVPVRIAPEPVTARRAALCILGSGTGLSLRPLSAREAMRRLGGLEPGFDLLLLESEAAYRALADNAWHLTLSADPAEAIDLLRANLARLGCTPPP